MLNWKPWTLMAAASLALAACGQDKQPETVPPPPPPTLSEQGAEVVAAVCTGCHAANDDGTLGRISNIRKSPEGWEMTLARMHIYHGVELTADERRAAVKYLADTQGLAPEESAPYRYALERRANIQELGHGGEIMAMCARCHSYARVALQRRDEDEWKLLVHTHVGQWPTIEYQMLSRERDWLDDATGWVSSQLAKSYPQTTDAWTQWQAKPVQDLSGTWRTVIHTPGEGLAHGSLTISSTGTDEYAAAYQTTRADGTVETGDYAANVFTGYEWRGRGKFGQQNFRQVAAMSADGATLTGRTFFADRPERGSYIEAVRADRGLTRLLALNGESLRRGAEQKITLYGTGLDGDVSIGDGITVNVIERSGDKIVATVAVAADAVLGRRDVRVGASTLADAVAIYDQIGRVEVTPDYAVSRLGGGGGTLNPVSAQFEAVAFANGRDGKPGTKDDYRIGVVQAEWDVAPNGAAAEEMKDHLFAGKITPRGRFLPAAAGPNPQRVYGASNAGDLKVVAKVTEGNRVIEGVGRIVVTTPRWNNPPIY